MTTAVTTTAGAQAAPGSELDALIPDAAALSAAATGLAADPVQAAEQLVDKVFGADDRTAVAATGELLRRAGLPLVSAAGPVVAMPGGVTVVSAPIDVEQLPQLTRAIRNGVEYTPIQLSQTLDEIGATTGKPLTGADTVRLLAAWGKESGAPTESVAAGATVRALARARGELLVPGALVDAQTLTAVGKDPQALTPAQLDRLGAPGRLTGVDPMTLILLVAHAAGAVTDRPQVVAAGQGLRASADGPCSAFKDISDTDKAVIKTQLRKSITTSVGPGLADRFQEQFNAYDKGTDVISTTMLLLGAKLDLVASPPTTHFRHESGDTSKDVMFVAQATFYAPLAEEHLDCWAFAGIVVPPNGPLNGFRVRWKVFNGLPVLQAKKADTDKVLHGGLTEQGVTTLTMFPRTESKPPKPGESIPEVSTENFVIASLDSDDFPFKFSDLVTLANGPRKAALLKAWNIGVAWMKRAGLPTRRLRYQVTYHADSPYVITSNTSLNLFGFASVELDADLYSCTGPGGPWKGKVALTGDPQDLLKFAGQVVGQKVPDSDSVDFPMEFTLNPKSSAPTQIPFGNKLGLTIALDPDAIAAAEHPTSTNDNWDLLTGRLVVGEGSYLSGGIDIRSMADVGSGGLIKNPQYAVVAAVREPRCPGATFWDDRFDDD